MSPLIAPDDVGLACAAGPFHIDPWRPATRALITHAHADHARSGSGTYYAAEPSVPLLRRRLGVAESIRGVPYGETFRIGDARVSFHPSGHILGAAQIRVEAGGEVWVVTGDYKRDSDPTCAPFESVHCDVLITEATFALPVYRWPDPATVVGEIFDWWQQNRSSGRTSVLFCYSLGKAQRVLGGLSRHTREPAWAHGAIDSMTEIYRRSGIDMLPTRRVPDRHVEEQYRGALVLAPPGAGGTPWMRRFREVSTGFCSGWMQVRGNRRRRGYDRGFVLSDHADWSGLLTTIRESGASRVLATHGRSDAIVRYLNEHGVDAAELATLYAGEAE
jgi:putative mRNA 3-end processing factor